MSPDAVAQPVAPKQLRFPVRRLARRPAEALRDQFDTLKSKLDESAAKRETDKHEIISEVRAARRTPNGFEGAEETLDAADAKAEIASSETEEALRAIRARGEAASTMAEDTSAASHTRIAAVPAKMEEALGAIGAKVDAAFAKTEEALGAVGAKVAAASAKTEEALGAVGAKVAASSTKTNGHIVELAARMSDAGQTLQLVHAQQAGMDGRVRRLGQALWGLTGVVGLGFTALVFVAWRSSTVSVGAALDVVPGIHGEMGEPKTGKPVPDHPLPGQSRAPCAMGTETLSGGCWLKLADQKPPCLPGFYFHGNACYVVVYPKPQSFPSRRARGRVTVTFRPPSTTAPRCSPHRLATPSCLRV